MFFPDSLIRRNTWEFYDQLTGSFQYACVVLAHAHVHACNVLFIPHYTCLPVTYLQLSVCTYQRNVYTRICYLYCITSFDTQCIDVSYCDRVKGRSLVRDPNSGIFHDLVKGSTLACSPRPLWVLLLWHFLFSCWTFLDYVSKRYSQNVTLYNGRVLRYTALKPFSVI